MPALPLRPGDLRLLASVVGYLLPPASGLAEEVLQGPHDSRTPESTYRYELSTIAFPLQARFEIGRNASGVVVMNLKIRSVEIPVTWHSPTRPNPIRIAKRPATGRDS